MEWRNFQTSENQRDGSVRMMRAIAAGLEIQERIE